MDKHNTPSSTTKPSAKTDADKASSKQLSLEAWVLVVAAILIAVSMVVVIATA